MIFDNVSFVNDASHSYFINSSRDIHSCVSSPVRSISPSSISSCSPSTSYIPSCSENIVTISLNDIEATCEEREDIISDFDTESDFMSRIQNVKEKSLVFATQSIPSLVFTGLEENHTIMSIPLPDKMKSSEEFRRFDFEAGIDYNNYQNV